MSAGSLAGLALFQAFLLAVGSSILWAVRGVGTWRDLVRLGGVSYLLGLAAFGVVATLWLVAGLDLDLPTVLLLGGVLAVGGAAVALWRRTDLAPEPRRSFPAAAWALAPAALSVVLLEAIFRAGRLRPLSEWDAWAFWIPKAKAIYLFGGLDEELFKTLPGQSYPPLIPALHAAAFHFMGSADVVTLHLQSWAVLVAFVAAVAGLLAGRVSPVLVWSSLLLVLATPQIAQRGLDPQGDVPLDLMAGVAALLCALWLLEGRGWTLAAATLLLAGACLTKREGLLLSLCIFVATAAVAVHARRPQVRRLAVAAGAVFALSLPWRLWFTLRDLPGDEPEAGPLELLDHLDRALPALELAISTAFDVRFWLVLVPFVLVAAAVGMVMGERIVAPYASLLGALLVLGAGWVMWSFPSLPLTKDGAVSPIIRLVGGLIVAFGALAPLVVQRALDELCRDRPLRGQSPGPRFVLPVMLAAAVVYPAVALARGAPPFPSRSDCVRVATPVSEGELELVFGRSERFAEARELLRRVRAVGYSSAEQVQDGCGLWKVAVPGYTSWSSGQGAIAEARGVDLEPRLEVGPAG